MNELTFARPELWPWLLITIPVWFSFWWGLRRRAAASQAYGAILTERVSAPWISAEPGSNVGIPVKTVLKSQ